VLKDATVAIEDQRFYQHKGVDYEGVIRAGVQNLVNQKTVQGGSTITMQLARNLYISSERTYQRKIREAKVAQEIEEEHSKQWILDKYLNTVPYGTWAGSRRSAPRPPRGSTSTSASASCRCARPRCWPACRRRPRCTRRCAARAPPRRAATTSCARWRARG
jgi:hypothetical protein